MDKVQPAPSDVKRALEIDARADICALVDEAACQGCGLEIPMGAPADPAWLIESRVEPARAGVGPVELATILCPDCRANRSAA